MAFNLTMDICAINFFGKFTILKFTFLIIGFRVAQKSWANHRLIMAFLEDNSHY